MASAAVRSPMQWRMLALVGVVLVAGCGRPGTGGTPVVSPPTSALVLWQGFAADAKPRPIVWLGNSSPQGFTTDGGKIAAMCSRFVLGAGLPKNLPAQAVATWTDGTTGSYLGISAADAFAAMSRPNPAMSASDCASANPLVISGARLATFDFDTDRGKAKMTAWLFTATGVTGEFAYPALAPTAFWKGGMTTRSFGQGATAGADGRSVTYRFWGAPENAGPCGASYKGVVAESASAVAIAIEAHPNSPPDAPIACTAVAAERSVMVTLQSPLGGRVVADAEGGAVAVCPAAMGRDC